MERANLLILLGAFPESKLRWARDTRTGRTSVSPRHALGSSGIWATLSQHVHLEFGNL